MKQMKMKTWVGYILLKEENGFLIALEFSNDEFIENDSTPLLCSVERELIEYFQGNRTSFDIPIKLNGTDFQKAIWEAMSKIPYGETVSYGELSNMAGYKKAYQAVGNACGKNPIAIIVPCHRVLAANKKIGGFSGGLDKKRILLKIEGIQI